MFIMLGFFIIEIIIFLSLFITFYYFLENNEELINNTLISQSDEIFNSVNFLINSKLNSVTKELLLFNQHLNIKQEYNIYNDINQDNLDCEILDSKKPKDKMNFNIEDIIKDIKDKERSVKIDSLLENENLKNIALFSPENDFQNFIDNNINKGYVCYIVYILKSIITKNVISNQYLEKLNYTLYVNDLILFYPWKKINDDNLKSLPFYNQNQDNECIYSKYNFKCSSIFNYGPTEEGMSLENIIIYMNLTLVQKNLYINSCINTNIAIYKESKNNDNKEKQFFCIASNLTNILEGINYESNYLTFNIIQYNEKKDSINLLYSSNDNFYKDISLNKETNFDLFSSDEYGEYKLQKNTEENIADLFHLLYYEIEKQKLFSKTKQEIIDEYEKNIKEIKEAIKNKESYKNIIVKQSFVRYEYNNKGIIDYGLSYAIEDDFMYILRPIETETVKIIKEKNLIDRNNKKRIFYTLTVMKLAKPKRSLVYYIHNFICLRIFFYSLTFEAFVCIIFYIIIFFLMRCILNPFKIFKANIEKLIDNNVKGLKVIEKEQNNVQKNLIQIKQRNIFGNDNFHKNDEKGDNINNNTDSNYNINEKQMKIKSDDDYNNVINIFKQNSEIEHEYTNIEMKEIENIITFLEKILLLRDPGTPYQIKADFYQSISSEISKKYQLDLFHCQLQIVEYYIKDKQYLKAKKELENFQIRLDHCRADYINKDKYIEKKNAFISSYNDTYINNFTNNTSIKNDKFISLEMITEKYHYLRGLTNYFLFSELKQEKKEILNEYGRQKNIGIKILSDVIAKNLNLNVNNNGIDLNSQMNKLTEKMDYHLELAIKHFKESYKINNSLKINQIKNIIILVYLSKCYIEFSNKSIEESNKFLKKAILSLSNLNKFIIELTDSNGINIDKKKLNNNNNNFLIVKNFGFLVSKVIKKFYIDSRVMLIVNGSLMQLILYQIGKIALKMHKIKSAYFCFVKLVQISFFQNENIHFKAIKWLRFILKNQINKGKKNSTLKLLQFQSKRKNNNYSSLGTGEEEEIFIKKPSIEYMKSYIKSLIEIFEKNKYKRREKKLCKELLSLLEKRIDYNNLYQKNNIRKRSRINSRQFFQQINQHLGNISGPNRDLSNEEDNSSSISNNRNGQYGVSPSNNQDRNNIESIPKSEYDSITKSFITKDLLIAQIIHSPIKLKQEEKIFKNIEKQYFRLNTKKKSNKCLIIILSEIFLDNFNSLKSFNLFMQYCINKFLDDKDKVGYIYYSFSSGNPDKFYELEYKEKALKKLDELFQYSNIMKKDKKSLIKKKYLTDSFDIAMDMFNNEQLNNDYDIDIKTDKYIFCFGTLNGLRYKCFEASFSQTNRMNYSEISLYYFVFDSIENNRDKISHYKKYFKKFIEGFLIFVENFKLIKLCFTNICKEGKQKNIFSNKIECIKNIIQ